MSSPIRTRGARTLELAGAAANIAAARLRSTGGRSLDGDRWIEWSFCFARLAEGSGRTLDFGADVGVLALAAAQRGHDVVAFDRVDVPPSFAHERVARVTADILDRPALGGPFDQVVNCSSIEHVGLAGRYGSFDRADGDLEAMGVLREAMASGGRMILTIPVGRDMVCPPLHRIYGAERLPRLLDGFTIDEQQFWAREATWAPVDRDRALATQGSESFYSLGLFVLRRP